MVNEHVTLIFLNSLGLILKTSPWPFGENTPECLNSKCLPWLSVKGHRCPHLIHLTNFLFELYLLKEELLDLPVWLCLCLFMAVIIILWALSFAHLGGELHFRLCPSSLSPTHCTSLWRLWSPVSSDIEWFHCLSLPLSSSGTLYLVLVFSSTLKSLLCSCV